MAESACATLAGRARGRNIPGAGTGPTTTTRERASERERARESERESESESETHTRTLPRAHAHSRTPHTAHRRRAGRAGEVCEANVRRAPRAVVARHRGPRLRVLGPDLPLGHTAPAHPIGPRWRWCRSHTRPGGTCTSTWTERPPASPAHPEYSSCAGG
jgi:hypothetical protein